MIKVAVLKVVRLVEGSALNTSATSKSLNQLLQNLPDFIFTYKIPFDFKAGRSTLASKRLF
jgi:hypothetical protein